jgi:hypothetical protein
MNEFIERMLRSTSPTISTNLLQILIGFFGGLYCLFPLLIGPSINFRDSVDHFDLTSRRNRDSSIVAIALTVPIFVDLITETIASIVTGDKSNKVKMHVKQALLNSRERFVIACGIVTVPLTAFLPPSTPNLVNIYLCLYKCRLILVGGTVFASLCRYNPVHWPAKATYSAVTLLAVACSTGAFADNFYPPNTSSVAHSVATILFMAGSFIFFACNFRWLYFTLPPLIMHYVRSNPNIRSTTGSADLLFPVLYVLTVTLASLSLSIFRRLYPENIKQNSEGLFYHNLGFNIYLLFVMYISEKMMKYEVVQGLVSSLTHATLFHFLMFILVCLLSYPSFILCNYTTSFHPISPPLFSSLLSSPSPPLPSLLLYLTEGTYRIEEDVRTLHFARTANTS